MGVGNRWLMVDDRQGQGAVLAFLSQIINRQSSIINDAKGPA
jgi:hypothetical protein